MSLRVDRDKKITSKTIINKTVIYKVNIRHAGNKETRFNKNVERKDPSGKNKDTNV